MSVKLMGRVWELDLPHSQQSVALALADHGKDDGTSIFPSVGHVAWKVGYSERQVQRIVRQLQDRGLLVKVAEAAGHRPIEYRMDVGAAPAKPPWKPARDDRTSGRQDGTPDIGVAPGVTSTTARGDMVASPKPSREPSEEPPVLPADAGSVSAAPTHTLSQGDEDARRLSGLLSSLVRAEAGTASSSGWCKPTEKWHQAATAMMVEPDEEGRVYTAEQIEYAIRFVIRHHYWSKRIKSLPRLRAEMPEVVKDIVKQRQRGGHLNAVDGDPLAGYSKEARARLGRTARRMGVTVEQLIETNPQGGTDGNGNIATNGRLGGEAAAPPQPLLAGGATT